MLFRSWIPISTLPGRRANFWVYDSLLSEYAALGYEYGYAHENKDALVLWEAQFGDFVNGAQIIIDQYLVAAEEKWGQHNGLVLLLPHGFDKGSASANVAVHGDALADPSFTDQGDVVHYSMAVPADAIGPIRLEAEFLYQPVGYRWANNLRNYDAYEPRRFVAMYESMANGTATTMATAAGVVR